MTFWYWSCDVFSFIPSYCKFKIINDFFTELQHMETVLNSVVYMLFFTIFIKKNILQQLIN